MLVRRIELTEALKVKSKTTKTMEAAILEVLRDAIKETHNIRFEGNNYSEEWVKEAERRGLPNLRKTPEAQAELVSAKTKAVLTGLGILSEAELVSRYHVRTERYVKNLMIEVETLRAMVSTQILPAAYAYHGLLAAGASAAKTAGIVAPQMETLNRLTVLIQALHNKATALESAGHKVEKLTSEEDKAKWLSREVSTAMAEVRTVCDELESIVADDFWPLPKYREMLFLS